MVSNTVIQRRNPTPTRSVTPASRPLRKEAPRTIKEDRKPNREIRNEKPRSAPKNNGRQTKQAPRQKQQGGNGRRK
jgi:hypothetical protein